LCIFYLNKINKLIYNLINMYVKIKIVKNDVIDYLQLIKLGRWSWILKWLMDYTNHLKIVTIYFHLKISHASM